MLEERLDSVRETLRRDSVRSISRRYFISNGFDGTLTSIGIAVGSFLSGVPSGMTVAKIGVGAAVGLATSGVWSVWEIEKAEKLSDLQRVEDAMLEDLDDTEVKERKREARKINALMSGLGPTIGILLPMVPFLFEGAFITMLEATLISIAVGVGVLFSFGSYMGSISKQLWWKAGIRMGMAGVVVAIINVMLPG